MPAIGCWPNYGTIENDRKSSPGLLRKALLQYWKFVCRSGRNLEYDLSEFISWRFEVKRFLLVVTSLVLTSAAFAGPTTFAERVAAGMEGEHRSESNKARDQYRHPVETLEFFAIENGMTVMEIWPGGGWYTEILAPAIRNHGKLIIATWDPKVEGQSSYRYELPKTMAETFAQHPEVYDQVGVEYFSPPESASLGEAGSIDVVLTFRNIHGWVNGGLAQDVFTEFARVLKPGGVLGVVQHRADDGADPLVSAKTGYVSEAAVREFANNAGLLFEEGSEVNANPADSKDHPKGVWTLPPSYRLGDVDKEKYTAIGESDRMTLRFRKPQ
jgi:predicted methyltransferase